MDADKKHHLRRRRRPGSRPTWKAARFAGELAAVEAKPADIVITTNGGYPLDQNVYQHVKGLTRRRKRPAERAGSSSPARRSAMGTAARTCTNGCASGAKKAMDDRIMGIAPRRDDPRPVGHADHGPHPAQAYGDFRHPIEAIPPDHRRHGLPRRESPAWKRPCAEAEGDSRREFADHRHPRRGHGHRPLTGVAGANTVKYSEANS